MANKGGMSVSSLTNVIQLATEQTKNQANSDLKVHLWAQSQVTHISLPWVGSINHSWDLARNEKL